MQGQQMIQQTKHYEQKAVQELFTGNYSQSSNKNQLQKDIQKNLPEKKSEPKDKNVLEIMGDGFMDLAQLNYTAQLQLQQAEEEKRQAFCEYLGTREGQQTAAAIIGLGTSLALAPYAAPALVAYLEVETAIGAAMITAGTYGGITFGTTSLINSVTEGNSAGRVFTDTLQGTVDGFVISLPAGAVDYGTAQLLEKLKGTAIYQTIKNSVDKIFGRVDDLDNVNSPTGSGSNHRRVWDYSEHFDDELLNFNDGYEIKSIVEEDMYIVQFHSDADVGNGRSLKYWTTIDEANGISTIEEYMDKMAIMSDWGARDNVSIAKIPAGTEVKHAIGTAREQIGATEKRTGEGLQLLFEYFDESWIIETKPLP